MRLRPLGNPRRASPERRRWRGPAIAWAGLALASLAACERPEPQKYVLQRATFVREAGGGVAPSPEILVAGEVSRPGIRLRPDDERAVARLEDLPPGRIVAHLASAGRGVAGSARISLRETGWRDQLALGWHADCTIEWGAPGTPADPVWRPCVFDLPRSLPSAVVSVERRGGADFELFVADLFLVGPTASKQPPVFVLLVDATGFDLLRPFRKDAPFGEHLEALSHDSVLLRGLRSTTSWTRPAVATLLTGLRADRHRVHERGDKLGASLLTVPEMLQREGYATYGWSANANVLPLWGFGQGFDAFVDEGSRRWAVAKTDGAELIDRLRAALAVRGPQAGFYYLHMMDAHGPYVPSKEQRGVVDGLKDFVQLFPYPLAALSRPEDWNAFKDYAGELLDLDDHIGTFVQVLRDEGLYDEALVLVVADHGEEFLDHRELDVV